MIFKVLQIYLPRFDREEIKKQKQKQNKTKNRSHMEELDTHFQDHNNLLLHTEALQAPSSNQLLLGLA